MTGPEDQETRPISVAELLARNGTIGAPPIGGRRRRRRGNTDAVTVAELTGENPVVHTGEIPAVEPLERPAAPDRVAANGTAERVAEPSEHERSAAHPGDHPDDYEADLDEYLESIRGPRVRADQMAPDQVDDDELSSVSTDEHPAVSDDQPEGLPSYLHTAQTTLFGGHTVADHLPRGRSSADAEDEVGAAGQSTDVPVTPMQQAMRAGMIVLQSIIAVAFGAGLFMAFDELWKWNKIVAMVLAVLVILGLVLAVRLVRKTEDITSTLIAVVVGALVTFGPLALLQPI